MTFSYFSFEHQQALLQEHLATLAQKESESVPTTVLGDGTTAFYSERHRADTDKEKAEMLVSYTCVCQRCLFKFVKIVLLLSFNLKHVFKTLLGSQRFHFFVKKQS